MAKKLSKFGAKFKEARDKGEKVFNFGGKSYNTKMKGEGNKKSSSRLPKTTDVKPTARPEFKQDMNPLKSGIPVAGGLGVKPGQRPKKSEPLKESSPAARDKRKSLAYIKNAGSAKGALDKMKGIKADKPAPKKGFRETMKSVVGNFKKQTY